MENYKPKRKMGTKQSFKPNRCGRWNHCPIKLLCDCSSGCSTFIVINSTATKPEERTKNQKSFIFWRRINHKSIMLNALFDNKSAKKLYAFPQYTPNTKTNVYREKEWGKTAILRLNIVFTSSSVLFNEHTTDLHWFNYMKPINYKWLSFRRILWAWIAEFFSAIFTT